MGTMEWNDRCMTQESFNRALRWCAVCAGRDFDLSDTPYRAWIAQVS